MKRDALDVELRQELRREVEAGGRRRRRARIARVDGLVALRLGERLGDVRGKRHLAVRLGVQAEPPAAVAQRLEQLDGPQPLARTEPPRGTREPLPDVSVELLDQQHLGRASRLAPHLQARGHDACVVHDDELVPQLLGKLEEAPVPHVAARALVDEQPRLVSPLGGVLRN